jgi:uncharacterized protein (TIGR00266 family)
MLPCMAFCTNCGTQNADEVAFCGSCGTPTGGSAPAVAPTATPVVTAAPLKYEIEGDNLECVRIHLKPGQEIVAEAGKMVYKTPDVSWETKMTGDGISGKLMGALKRKLTGESLFLTHFKTSGGAGDVGFAGEFPGRIQAFNLAAGQSVLCQRDAFIVSDATVELGIAFTKKLGAGFFGGEGFILQKLTGPGTAFIHAGGDFVEFNLTPGEVLQVDTGCIVAFDESVQYSVEMAGGIATSIFGGEGLFLATLTGPGRVIVQTMTLSKLRRQLGGGLGGKSGGGEASGLGALTSFLGSDD